jgi:hypothetical protein
MAAVAVERLVEAAFSARQEAVADPVVMDSLSEVATRESPHPLGWDRSGPYRQLDE